jgi:hypothetical protein
MTLAASLILAPAAVAQARQADVPPPTAPASQAPSQTVSPADLERVRKALDKPSILDLNEERLRFYASVTEKAPMTFAEYAKGYDLWNGPTKGGNPMTHQEFLAMVTPKELYGSGGITASELLQFSLTNWIGQKLLRRGLEELKEAKTEREAREIRERIERELRALRTYEGN